MLEPRHYLPLLARKPGLLHNGRPFQGEPFGPDFALLRRELEYRYAADGTKQFLRVLLLLTEHPECGSHASFFAERKTTFFAVRDQIITSHEPHLCGHDRYEFHVHHHSTQPLVPSCNHSQIGYFSCT